MAALPPGIFQSFYEKCLKPDERDPVAYSLMSEVFAIGMNVNQSFKYFTASSFFKLLGLKGELKTVYSFNLYSALHSDSDNVRDFKSIYSKLVNGPHCLPC